MVAVIAKGRWSALEVRPYCRRGDRFSQEFPGPHDVIAMKIMAAEAGLPAFLADESLMRNINRILAQPRVLMTGAAEAVVLERDPPAGVLHMAGDARFRVEGCPGLRESRLDEAVDRVPLVRPVVAGEAGIAAGWLPAKVRGSAALAENVAQVCLDLLARRARCRLMAFGARDFLMPGVHRSVCVECFVAGLIQDQQCQQACSAAGKDRPLLPGTRLPQSAAHLESVRIVGQDAATAHINAGMRGVDPRDWQALLLL